MRHKSIENALEFGAASKAEMSGQAIRDRELPSGGVALPGQPSSPGSSSTAPPVAAELEAMEKHSRQHLPKNEQSGTRAIVTSAAL